MYLPFRKPVIFQIVSFSVVVTVAIFCRFHTLSLFSWFFPDRHSTPCSILIVALPHFWWQSIGRSAGCLPQCLYFGISEEWVWLCWGCVFVGWVGGTLLLEADVHPIASTASFFLVPSVSLICLYGFTVACYYICSFQCQHWAQLFLHLDTTAMFQSASFPLVYRRLEVVQNCMNICFNVQLSHSWHHVANVQ